VLNCAAAGALDGLAIKIAGPKASECKNPRTYYNRKGFFSVNCQAICDANKCFTYASMITAGSTHDATAWACTGLSARVHELERHHLWLVADDAYPVSEYMITPYQGCDHMARDDSDFNYTQSSLRINIECAFGLLVRRWGILWRKLEVPLKKVKKVVWACMILHNICTRGVGVAPGAIWAATGTRPQDHSAFVADIKKIYGMTLQSEIEEESQLWRKEKLSRRRETGKVSKMRDALAEECEKAGRRRPRQSELLRQQRHRDSLRSLA